MSLDRISPRTAPAPTPSPGPTTIGDIRVGRRTLGTIDDAVVRFRVEPGSGDDIRLVPDTERARILDSSPAGPRLHRALQRAIDGAAWALPKDGGDLNSITLAPDVDAIAGATVLADMRVRSKELPPDELLDAALAPEDADALRSSVRSTRAFFASRDGINGAFNPAGNIVFMPDYSRALLAAVGAYDPTPTEASGRGAAGWVQFMPKLLRHELEHSVSPTKSYGEHAGLDGLEEGTGEAMTDNRPVTAAARHDLPPAAHRYGRVDRRSAEATEGWRPHRVPGGEQRAREGDESNQRYVKRESLVAELVRLAGIDRNTRAGLEQTRELLQRVRVDGVPDVLARAIAAKHDIAAERRDELVAAIRDITESRADDPIAELGARFGIPGA